jgi:hypothetical protein
MYHRINDRAVLVRRRLVQTCMRNSSYHDSDTAMGCRVISNGEAAMSNRTLARILPKRKPLVSNTMWGWLCRLSRRCLFAQRIGR